MTKNTQPLAEVFGHFIEDISPKANRYRSGRLCPFNNRVPNCTKDKAKNPLGVCSVFHDGAPVITCPIRFREDWLIYDLQLVKEDGQARFTLTKTDEVFTEFEPALLAITTSSPGNIDDFIKLLQEKLDEQLETPPNNKTIEKPF